MIDDAIEGRCHEAADRCAKFGRGRDRCLATWLNLLNIDSDWSREAVVKNLLCSCVEGASSSIKEVASRVACAPHLSNPTSRRVAPSCSALDFARRSRNTHTNSITRIHRTAWTTASMACFEAQKTLYATQLTPPSLPNPGSTPSPTRPSRSCASFVWALRAPKTPRLFSVC